MSTEQSEQVETPQSDTTQQATTPKPTPTQQRVKNPKRVAAGKLVAERTRLAREQQKKAAAEAAIIIANNKAKASNTVAAPDSNCVAAPAPEPADEIPKSKVDINKVDSGILSTTQWIAVGSLIASLLGLYYKREELKAVFNKKKTPEPQPVRAPQPARVTQPRGLKKLD